MQMNDMILVSVDDHICEPPDMWDRHLDAKWKDRAPRLIHKNDGSDPGGLGYPSLHDAHWDPFWRACADEGTIVCIHIGSGTRLNMQDVNAPIEIMIAGTPITLFSCATELVFSEIFTKFPGVKVRGYATIGDIMKQMAHALSTPFDSRAGGIR